LFALIRKEESVSRGAALVEATFVLSFLILIIFGYIEITRYISAKNQLRIATDRALETAQRITDLESLENQTNIENIARNFAATGLLTNASGSFGYLIQPGNSTYKILNLPPYTAGELETKLQSNPIRIELQARLEPMLSILPSMTVTANAVGFREPRRQATNPTPKDCNGNTLGSAYYSPTASCPCDGSCTDPAKSMQKYMGICQCRCNSARGFSTDASGNCVCPLGTTNVNNFCDTNSQYCPSGQTRNPSTNQCVCGAGATLSGSACVCNNTNQVYDNASLTCICPPAPPGKTLTDSNNCTFTCTDPSKTVDSNGECVLCRSGYTSSGVSNCICQNDPSITGISCPVGSTWNLAACKCLCDDPCYRVDGSTQFVEPIAGSCGSCPSCPAGQLLNGRSCQCDASLCTIPGQTPQSGSGCSCACPSGQSVYNNRCMTGGCVAVVQNGCPSGIIYGSDGSCTCDE